MKEAIQIHGHRGTRGWMPENTIPSFLEAVRLGADTLELDVLVSSDEKVLVSHEPWMNPVFCSHPDGTHVTEEEAETLNLFRMPYEAIRAFDVGLRTNPAFPQQMSMKAHKPLLTELIEKVDMFTAHYHMAPIRFNIEIKSEEAWDALYHPAPARFVDLLLEVLTAKELLPRCILQSFDVRILQEIKRRLPHQTMSLLVENNETWQANVDKLGFVPEIYGPEFVLLSAEVLQQIHQAQMKVIPWTLNEPKDIRQMLEWGVDGIISDYPDRVLTELDKFSI